MQRQTLAVSFYCRESEKDRNGQAPVLVSISVNGERQWCQTKFKASPGEWKKAMASAKDHPLKHYVATLRENFDTLKAELIREGLPITAKNLKYYFQKGGVNDTHTFDEIADEYLALQAQRIGAKNNSITKDTYNRYIKTVSMFKTCNTLTGSEPIRTIDNAHVRKYVVWLGERYDNATSCNYLQKLKALFKYAFESGKIQVQPFAGIKIKKGEKDEIKYLTMDEVEKIRKKDLHCERLEKVRDVFVFACYTGLGFADISRLMPSDFQTNDQNQIYLQKRRVKTGVIFTVPVLPLPLEIAQKYNYQLPVISNQKTNSFLKEIQVLCGIEKNLTYYMARHTAAVYLLNNHVPIETVSRVLGHKEGSKETKIYAKFLNQTVFDDFLDLDGGKEPDKEWVELMKSTVTTKDNGKKLIDN